ncbi:MAG TPA: diacylglycerol kinase family lipid kinase [Candidatus Fimivivens faecavium]|nr:diacylglycerol kinase family lipid kinase [Candidatus Fimivivens faecavium]
MKQKHIFIINPVAGKRDRTEEIYEKVRGFFALRGAEQEYEIYVSRAPGDSRDIARRRASLGGRLCFYACGGDGTLSEVLNGIAGEEGCSLAPVPIGSGNDFIRSFGEDAEQFYQLDKLVDGEEIVVDLLRVNPQAGEARAGINIVSVGLDCAVAKNAKRFKRIPFAGGGFAYKLSLLWCFFTSVKNRYEVELDGESFPREDYIFVVAANGRFYGGGFQASPRSRIDDGVLDLIRVPALPRNKILPMIGAYRRGEHLGYPGLAKAAHGRSVRILSERTIDVNIDGEIFPMENPLIELVPAAMSLRVPRACAAKIRNAGAAEDSAPCGLTNPLQALKIRPERL